MSITTKQHEMLRCMRAGPYPAAELLEDFAMSSFRSLPYPLAWRTADRVLGALLRKGLVVLDDAAENVELSAAGREVAA